ncbi:low molecular weight protein arginine phosphatase [Fredinandcohnia sp. 179-A 10B2 NHS]|uniref:low molecular weight protein arginine phosphatase n=1 Tax=Fredinandcohnia sp. 179-A 10B2 NHS TaxID=3235176 RepID=UPI0039A056CC
MVRVLFVCTGNTCRSPMAEAILKAKATDGIEVKSAGIFASNGTPASVNTAAVLKEKGIDSIHSSSLLSKELTDWASYILTMTNSHKQEILFRYPEASSKLFTLKEFVGSTGDISDPFGGPVEIYRETYNEMEPIIETLITKLKKA